MSSQMLEYFLKNMDQKFVGCHVSGIPIGNPFLSSYKQPIGNVEDETLYTFRGLDKFIILPFSALKKDVLLLVPSEDEQHALYCRPANHHSDVSDIDINCDVGEKQFNINPSDSIVGLCKPATQNDTCSIKKIKIEPDSEIRSDAIMKDSHLRNSVPAFTKLSATGTGSTQDTCSKEAPTFSVNSKLSPVAITEKVINLKKESVPQSSITANHAINVVKCLNKNAANDINVSMCTVVNKEPKTKQIDSGAGVCKVAAQCDSIQQINIGPETEIRPVVVSRASDIVTCSSTSVSAVTTSSNATTCTTQNTCKDTPMITGIYKHLGKSELTYFQNASLFQSSVLSPNLARSSNKTSTHVTKVDPVIAKTTTIISSKQPCRIVCSRDCMVQTDETLIEFYKHDIKGKKTNVYHTDSKVYVNPVPLSKDYGKAQSCMVQTGNISDLETKSDEENKCPSNAASPYTCINESDLPNDKYKDTSSNVGSVKKIETTDFAMSDTSKNAELSASNKENVGFETQENTDSLLKLGPCYNVPVYREVIKYNIAIQCQMRRSHDIHTCNSEVCENKSCLRRIHGRDKWHSYAASGNVHSAPNSSADKIKLDIEKKPEILKPIADDEDEKIKPTRKRRINKSIELDLEKKPKIIKPISDDEDDNKLSNRRKSSRQQSKGFRPDYLALEQFHDSYVECQTSEGGDENEGKTCDMNEEAKHVRDGMETVDEVLLTDNCHVPTQSNIALTELDEVSSPNGMSDEPRNDLNVKHNKYSHTILNQSNSSDDPDFSLSDSDSSSSDDGYIEVEPNEHEFFNAERIRKAKARLKRLENRIKINLDDHPDKFTIESVQSMERRHRGKPKEEISKEVYVCKLCDMFESDTKDMIAIHIEEHVNGDLDCKVCEFRGTSRFDLFKHRRDFHSLKIVCSVCGFTTHSTKDLKNHLGKDHNDPQYKCVYCPSMFATRSKRIHHETDAHKDQIKNWCDTCNQKFVTLSANEFETHTSTCTGIEEHPCEKCGKVFGDSKKAKSHFAKVHQRIRRHPCPKCSFKAPSITTLNRHLQTHDAIHPFKCDQCTFSCVQHNQLKSHMRTHTGHKPFKCDECNYAAAWNVQLKDHKKIHGLPVSVMCDDCGVLFKNNRTLGKHLTEGHCPKEVAQTKLE